MKTQADTIMRMVAEACGEGMGELGHALREGARCGIENLEAEVLHLKGLLREALPYVEGDGVTTTIDRVSTAERIQRIVRPSPAKDSA